MTTHKHLQAEILGVKYELEDSFNAGLYDSNTEGFTFVPTLLHPSSTGQVCFLIFVNICMSYIHSQLYSSYVHLVNMIIMNIMLCYAHNEHE